MSPLFNNVVINFVSDSNFNEIKNTIINKQFDVLRHLLPAIKSIEGIRIEDYKILSELNSRFTTIFLDTKVCFFFNK
jgi:hypothetical protein